MRNIYEQCFVKSIEEKFIDFVKKWKRKRKYLPTAVAGAGSPRCGSHACRRSSSRELTWVFAAASTKCPRPEAVAAARRGARPGEVAPPGESWRARRQGELATGTGAPHRSSHRYRHGSSHARRGSRPWGRVPPPGARYAEGLSRWWIWERER
jgi:hypothetical protein